MNEKPWNTPDLLRCIKYSDEHCKSFKMKPDNLMSKLIYDRYSKLCNNLLKKVKREHQQNEFQKFKNNLHGQDK